MKIALLTQNPSLYSSRRLMEAARERGHEIDDIKTLQVIINIASHRPDLFYAGGKLDLWYMKIDWDHVENRCPEGASCFAPEILRTGDTKIIIVQPTGTVGYRYSSAGSSLAN